MKYTIVIVTYNRLNLLKECISMAKNQTLTPEHIIIVNNASTDQTKEYLDSLNNPQLIIRHLPENSGGAGGFHEGLKLSLTTDADWSVIIDDDAMLDSHFLELIDAQASKSSDVQAYAGTVYQNGSIDLTHRQFYKRPGFMAVKPDKSIYDQDHFTCDLASFCGLVVSNELIRKIGLPEKDYFIWYDDTEYSIRIREHSPIVVIPAAYLNHKVAVPVVQTPRRYTWKDYYGLRNRMHMVKKHGNPIDVLYLHFQLFLRVGLRNWLFHIRHYQGYDWNFERETYRKAKKDW